MKQNIVCIVQARTGSSRLPGKIFLDLGGKPVLFRVVEQLKKSEKIDKIVIACPEKKEDDKIEKYVLKNLENVGIYRGSENDVLDRYYQAAVKYNADVVIRVTSDCPLIDPQVIDRVVDEFLKQKVDYATNTFKVCTYPRGLDVEVIIFNVLKRTWEVATNPDDREHVTLYIKKHPEIFSLINIENEKDYSKYRITLDEADDYKAIKGVYGRILNKGLDVNFKSIIEVFEEDPNLYDINKNVEHKIFKV